MFVKIKINKLFSITYARTHSGFLNRKIFSLVIKKSRIDVVTHQRNLKGLHRENDEIVLYLNNSDKIAMLYVTVIGSINFISEK